MPRAVDAVKPRLLDLFCGAGGATRGYQEAGFAVMGVDINPQPRYCGENFLREDAMAVLLDNWLQPIAEGFDAIHASPPCQRFSSITKVRGNVADHPDLVGPVREALERIGLPYVIENVVGAPLLDPIQLCGSHFGLAINEGELRRHRLFECSFPIEAPPKCRHPRGGRPTLGIYGGGTRQDTRIRKNKGGGNTQKANLAQGHALMRTPWMTRQEMTQAIPPAYTEFVGRALRSHLEAPAELAA